ncbi:hypothetical protein HPB50_026731 [Hyalomma asiaticum]|uniref:Uncharacterized protein n=1 Tax=Hyalomma asiaticum TaxID=266040 RepID=A0ACB7STR4_HYAAI|nr:hypothetical protein HPB50_026731 [Hyalomma asiaticum]
MWTDDYGKISYTTATAHYIDDKWKLHSHVLFTCDFPNEKKSGENVRKELLRRFAKLGVCSDALAKAIFVTDQGANIICALQPYDRLNCCAHLLNTVLRNTFAEEFIAEEATSIHENLQSVKCLLKFLKQSGLASQLNSGVIQEVPTRWNSKLGMLRSVFRQLENIEALLETRNPAATEHIDRNTIRDLITFLEPFEEATQALEADRCPTLQLAILHVAKIARSLDRPHEHSARTTEMSKIQLRARNFLCTKVKLAMYHKVATFLWPQFRHLRMLSPEEREEVHAHAKQFMDAFQFPTPCSASTKRPAKIQRMEPFSESCDIHDGSHNRDEVSEYLRTESLSACSESELLEFWKGKEKNYPKLAELARKILAIPATSASSERNFSAAGYVMQEQRTRLKPESMDNLSFLHDNL